MAVNALELRRRLLMDAPHKETAQGNPASFSTNMKAKLQDCVLALEPHQDLHGYSNPWPGGGGKNLFDIGEASGWVIPSSGSLSISGNVISIKILGAGGTLYWRDQKLAGNKTISYSGKSSKAQARVFIRCRKSDDSGWMTSSDATISGMTYNQYFGGWYSDLGETTSFKKEGIAIPACLYWNVGIGYNNVAVTTGNTETISEVQIENGSSATSYAPFSNICPITGYTGVDVTDAGNNLLNVDTVAEGQLNGSNGGVLTNASWRVSDFMPAPVGNVTITWDSATNFFQANICFYHSKSADTFISSDSAQKLGYGHTFAVPFGATYFRMSWSVKINGNDYPRTNIRVNIGSADLGYSAFTGSQTYPITWQTEAGTVYGGTVDVKTGVMTVDRATASYNSGFAEHSSGRWYHNGLPSGIVSSLEEKKNFVSNQRIYGMGGMGYGPYMEIAGTGFYLNKLSATETLSDLNTALTANPLQIVYPLATPITYQLTHTQITQLIGQNHLFMSADGQISLEYWKH